MEFVEEGENRNDRIEPGLDFHILVAYKLGLFPLVDKIILELLFHIFECCKIVLYEFKRNKKFH